MRFFSTAIGCPFFLLVCFVAFVFGQSDQPAASNSQPYEQLKTFNLTGGSVAVAGLTLKRDRVSMTFSGTFYLSAASNGRATGAVFIGDGSLTAEPPPNEFEKANLRRLIKADTVTSTFSTAAFRFTDDTASMIGAGSKDPAPQQAAKIAAELNEKTLRETGANLASRVMLSLLNDERPGFFYASFDGGRLGNFSFVMDHQNRIPTAFFGINGGEKGLIYTYKSSIGAEVLMAFHSEADYARSVAAYSDTHDLVDIEHYDMQIDLRSPKSRLGLRTTISIKPLTDGIRAISFFVGESLRNYEDERLKKQMRIKAVRRGETPVTVIQEDWEGGFTVVLPDAAQKQQRMHLEFELEGDFLREGETVARCSYPRVNEAWYPRHGYLDRATYSIDYLHSKALKVASVGVRQSEVQSADDKNVTLTTYKMTEPVALVTFALGPWQRHSESIKFEKSDKTIQIEFNSVSGAALPIKEDFILAELNNSVRYFNALFGAYPYDSYSATFHPYGFGQGFPTMLMIPPADRASKYTFAFISHETAHQWWGNIVSWRSYRDQWLSEGFAEYSGSLYTAARDGKASSKELLDEMRDSLKKPPRTLTGVGSGKLNDVGPIILGHRLSSTKTIGAYQSLIYNKGALVLRMIHFLMSDPATEDDKAFFAMMKDFVERYRNRAASTDDFRAVAGEHFAKSPIGRRYQLKNLDWFFDQWVYGSEMPSYKVDYTLTDNPDGSTLVTGNILQENVSESWFMPIPLVFGFGSNQIASGTIYANGPKTPFQMKLPRKPTKLEIDPNKWLIAEKISVSK